MALSDGDIAFARELFAPLGAITTRKMMGALAIYCDDQIFACLDSDGRPYLRTKGPLAAELEAEGAEPFEVINSKTGKTQRMGYWSLPEHALDDPEVACELARRALNEGA